MDVFTFLDSENRGLGDKPKGGEKTAKRNTVGSVPRKRLTDISNLPQRSKILSQDEISLSISHSTKEYIDKLYKENMALVKQLEERNKLIELSGIEIKELQINLHVVKGQNLQLAQANSQMLTELNLGKDKLKALRHELGCKNSLLKIRDMELEEKVKKLTCKETGTEYLKVRRKKRNMTGESSQTDTGGNKPCNTNRRSQSRSRSLGPSAKQIEDKEKAAERKRICLRRQSARFKPEDLAPTEDSLEIQVASSAVHPLPDDLMHDKSPTSLIKKQDRVISDRSIESKAFPRSSIGRPLRRAAEKVQCYKETPLNVKMRRPE